MKTLFVTALRHICIPEQPGRGIRLSDTHFLTSDRAVISDLISSDFTGVAGILEADAIKIAPAVIYRFATGEHFDAHADLQRYLLRELDWCSSFLMALWLVKDNAVNFELGFLEHPHKDARAHTLASNFLNVRFSTAIGDLATTEFSVDEVRASREAFKAIFEDGIYSRERVPQRELHKVKTRRVDRAWHFVHMARHSHTLSYKIAHYVSGLEALLCSGTGELTHRLSERLALLLGGTLDERLDVYRAAQGAYAVRSRVAHGDSLGKLRDKVPDIAAKCDDLVRRLLVLIYTRRGLLDLFDSPGDEFEGRMLQIMFSGSDGIDALLTLSRPET